MDQGHLADAVSGHFAGRGESGLRGRLWRAGRQGLPEECRRPDSLPLPAAVHGGPAQGLGSCDRPATSPPIDRAVAAAHTPRWDIWAEKLRGACGLGLVVRAGVCCHTPEAGKQENSRLLHELGRRFMRRLILAGVAAVLMMAPAAALADDTIVIKFSHVVANDTPKGKGALKFKELAEKYTNGKVKIEVYPNSSLYKDKEEIEALQLGSVQMLAPSTAKFAPLGVKEFEALDLPWLFKDEATYTKAMKGPIGKWLFQKLEAKGITGLAYWDNGFHMASANRPLLMPADFQGLKVRISGSKVADRYFRDLGSIPQIMAFSEVYQALQTGVVDGCENTPSNYT